MYCTFFRDKAGKAVRNSKSLCQSKVEIKYKKPIEEKKEELHEKDRPRYEEQSEEEYLKHCERFFKGWDDDKVE